MSIYAISDLHLSFNANKPMDIFGVNWENHIIKLKANWIKQAKENDIIVLGGDFSWSTYLKDTIKDFKFLNNLPGKKILLKGNHDYWWTTLTNMNNYLKENKIEDIFFLYNNSYLFENYIIAGTKGWNFNAETDKKLLNRELQRLETSIKSGIYQYGNKEIMLFVHYPPINEKNIHTEFIKIMKKYNVKKCFYGHLHGINQKEAVEGNINGIEFKLISSDYTDFKLIKII